MTRAHAPRFLLPFVLLAAGGCDKGATETKAADAIGVAECDTYIAKYEACLAKMGPQAKAQAESTFASQRAAFKSAASTAEGRTSLAAQCRAALDAIRPTCGS